MDANAADPSRRPRTGRPSAIARRCRRARQRRELAQRLPAAIEGIAADLRAGADLASAVRAMALSARGARLTAVFAPLLEVRSGGPALERAFLSLCERIGGVELTLLAHAIVIARGSPQAQSNTFLRLARRLRARRQAELRIAALRTRARRLGIAAGVLPLAALAGAVGLDPPTAQLLLARPAGWLLLGLLALLLLGGLVLLGRTLSLDAAEH
jgi:Flp pilus assembly protein TadB